MRTALGLALLALMLSACNSSVPQDVVKVPGDIRIFDGYWEGNAQSASAEASSNIQVAAKATYATPNTYTFTGGLTFRGQTYALSGTGSVSGNITLKPQMSPALPIFQWKGKLLRNGLEVGSISSKNKFGAGITQSGDLILEAPNGDSFTFSISRIYP